MPQVRAAAGAATRFVLLFEMTKKHSDRRAGN
jgi:hypothetical protein